MEGGTAILEEGRGKVKRAEGGKLIPFLASRRLNTWKLDSLDELPKLL